MALEGLSVAAVSNPSPASVVVGRVGSFRDAALDGRSEVAEPGLGDADFRFSALDGRGDGDRLFPSTTSLLVGRGDRVLLLPSTGSVLGGRGEVDLLPAPVDSADGGLGTVLLALWGLSRGLADLLEALEGRPLGLTAR